MSVRDRYQRADKDQRTADHRRLAAQRFCQDDIAGHVIRNAFIVVKTARTPNPDSFFAHIVAIAEAEGVTPQQVRWL